MNATAHKLFSPARIRTIAANTFLELVRLKVFYFMLLFAIVLIGSSMIMVNFTFQQQFQVLKDVSLGAMSIFTWLLAVLATAMLLPKDIEDRTLYTILAKPVPRLEYLLGKLLGVLLMLLTAIALMGVAFAIVLYAHQQIVIGKIYASGGSAEDIQESVRNVKAVAFSFNLLPGVAIIYLKAALCASLTLLLSTFASSWIFTVITSIMVYFIGHVQHIAREYWFEQLGSGPSPVLKALTGFVALVFPDFQLFNLVDDIVVGNAVPMAMFLKTGALGLSYIGVYTFVAYLFFANKEL